jgi:hypothetical protein
VGKAPHFSNFNPSFLARTSVGAGEAGDKGGLEHLEIKGTVTSGSWRGDVPSWNPGEGFHRPGSVHALIATREAYHEHLVLIDQRRLPLYRG